MKKTFDAKDRNQHKQGEKINNKEETEAMHQGEIKTKKKKKSISSETSDIVFVKEHAILRSEHSESKHKTFKMKARSRNF